jgi:hypothetical protein
VLTQHLIANFKITSIQILTNKPNTRRKIQYTSVNHETRLRVRKRGGDGGGGGGGGGGGVI